MAISPTESLSIAELVIYPPTLLALIFVIIRHGISRQSGFIFLASFLIIRIIGAGFGVAAAKNPTNVSDFIWSSILGSVGIGALLLSTFMLLKRIIDQTSERTPPSQLDPPNPFLKVLSYVPIIGRVSRILDSNTGPASYRSKLILLIQLPQLAALVLCIDGGVDATSSSISEQKEGKRLLKAGIILFTVFYAILFLLVAKSVSEFHKVPRGEKRILVVVAAAVPLIGVRILWTLLAYFSNISDFSPIHPNIVVRAFMANLEEFLVVISYTVVGLMVPKYEGKRGTDHLLLESVDVPAKSQGYRPGYQGP